MGFTGRRPSLPCIAALAVALSALPGCSQSRPTPYKSTKKAPADAKEAKAVQPVEGDKQFTTAVKTPNDVTKNTKPEGATELGMEFRDPPWFHRGIFPGATVIQQSRSERGADGFFTSQFLFELAEGVNQLKCVTDITDHIKDVVPELAVKNENKRAVLTGKTDYYDVTMVCGVHPNGKVRALVSYRWTAVPKPPAGAPSPHAPGEAPPAGAPATPPAGAPAAPPPAAPAGS